MQSKRQLGSQSRFHSLRFFHVFTAFLDMFLSDVVHDEFYVLLPSTGAFPVSIHVGLSVFSPVFSWHGKMACSFRFRSPGGPNQPATCQQHFGMN